MCALQNRVPKAARVQPESCNCVIHASGTVAKKFSRRQTGASDWDDAKAIAEQWEAAGAWDASALPARAGTSQSFADDQSTRQHKHSSIRSSPANSPRPPMANTRPSSSSFAHGASATTRAMSIRTGLSICFLLFAGPIQLATGPSRKASRRTIAHICGIFAGCSGRIYWQILRRIPTIQSRPMVSVQRLTLVIRFIPTSSNIECS